jgi:hypothetical protein
LNNHLRMRLGKMTVLKKKTHAMLAAPNTPNLRAPFCFGTCGGAKADHTRLIRVAILLSEKFVVG